MDLLFPVFNLNTVEDLSGTVSRRHRFQIPTDDDLITGVEDFRNTLLWLPRAQTDDNGEFSITIPTSNVKSTFKLQIMIITDNVRDMKTETEYFKVI